MTARQTIHLFLVALINLVIVGILVRQAWEGNDKAIILVIFFYPALIIVNAIVWGILKSVRSPDSAIYRRTTIALLLLFIPVVLVAAMY